MTDPIDDLLAQMKAQYAARDREEAQQQQQQQTSERREQEKNRLQHRSGLAQQAVIWLRQLEPHSEAAVRFEKFAARYSASGASRLEAAIAYLQSQE